MMHYTIRPRSSSNRSWIRKRTKKNRSKKRTRPKPNKKPSLPDLAKEKVSLRPKKNRRPYFKRPRHTPRLSR